MDTKKIQKIIEKHNEKCKFVKRYKGDLCIVGKNKMLVSCKDEIVFRNREDEGLDDTSIVLGRLEDLSYGDVFMWIQEYIFNNCRDINIYIGTGDKGQIYGSRIENYGFGVDMIEGTAFIGFGGKDRKEEGYEIIIFK